MIKKEKKSCIKAVILAAGLSSRMGKFKPLLPYAGRKVITHLLEQVLLSGFASVTVVTGHNSILLEKELSSFNCDIVHNSLYELGMHTSVIAGVKSLVEPYDGYMQFLGDQPEITSALINNLITFWQKSEKGIAIASYSQKGGHPVLFDKKYVPQILTISEGEGLRAVIKSSRDDIDYMDAQTDSVLFDIDTPEDYQKLLKRSQKG